MNIEEYVKKLQAEIESEKQEVKNTEGLVRLQEVMKEYNGEFRLIWSDDLQKEMATRPEVKVHNTGLDSFDKLTGGFREQQLITIGAHSKHGKTAFGIFLLEKLASLNPVMIPLEQSNEELIDQRVGNRWSVPRFLSPKTLAARVTVDWIEERVIEGIAKHNTKMVLVDHLGYIDDMGKDGELRRENHSYRIERIMQGLKNIAKKWNVVIVILVHIVKADEGKTPQLEDLKGSQSILGESDKVIMLWRENVLKKKIRIYKNRTLVSVLANRRTGQNGYVGLEFDLANGFYKENNEWVDSLVKMATMSVEADEAFDVV